jgi:hypothetical protein
MAFTIEYKGAVIRADTAQDVGDLLLVFAQPVGQRLLPPGIGTSSPVAGRGAPGRRREAATVARRRPRRATRKTRMGGGMAKTSSAPRLPMPGTPRTIALEERVLGIVRSGVSKPGDITTRAGATTFVVRQILKRLVASGDLRAEGKAMSRRYVPADSRRPAKEDVR